jgi:hypothetical protein
MKGDKNKEKQERVSPGEPVLALNTMVRLIVRGKLTPSFQNNFT